MSTFKENLHDINQNLSISTNLYLKTYKGETWLTNCTSGASLSFLSCGQAATLLGVKERIPLKSQLKRIL